VNRKVIINDTVGFIRDLPPDLLNAFRSTLEEIAGSRLLAHVVDASNPRWQHRLISVDRILRELEFDKFRGSWSLIKLIWSTTNRFVP